MLSRDIQCKQAPYTPILTKVGKGRHVCVCARLTGIPRFSRSAWAENIANAWLPRLFRHNTSRGHLDTPPKIFSRGKVSLVTSIATGTPRNAIDLLSSVLWPLPRVIALSTTVWVALHHATRAVNFCHTQEALQARKDTGMSGLLSNLLKRFRVQQTQ